MVRKGKTHPISGSSVIVLALVLFVGVAIFNGIAKQTSQESSERLLEKTPAGKAYGRVFYPTVESNVEGETTIAYPEMIGSESLNLNRGSEQLIDKLDVLQEQEITEQQTREELKKSRGFIIELKDPPLLATQRVINAEPEIQEISSQPPTLTPVPAKGVKGRTRSVKKPTQPPSAQVPLEQQTLIPEQLFSDEEITVRHQSARSKILGIVENQPEIRNNPANIITGQVVGADAGQAVSGEPPPPVVLGDYLLTFNGFALDISEEEANNLLELPEVNAVFPNFEVQEMLMDSVPIINADDVWKLDAEGNDCSASGRECLTGKGATIGIIDTGVDYTHPDLGGCLGGRFEKKTINEIPISIAPGVQNNPSIYEDKVVWESSNNGASYNIFMFDLKTNETKQITSNNKSISPAIQGDSVVWVQDGQIYLFDIPSGQTIQISNSTQSFAGTPWVFEDKVVWAGRPLTSNITSYDIYLHDLDSRAENKLTQDFPPAFRSAPRIYGDNIVWVEATSGYKLSMFLYNLLSGEGRNITGFPINSPGTNSLYIYKDLVVWSENRNGNLDIFLLNLSSNEERQITFDNSSQVHPSIYENKIVWVDSRELAEIYMFDLDKNEERRITYEEESWQTQPFIYKDLVVWTDSRGGFRSYDIYMANLSMPNGTYLQEVSPKGCKVAGGYDFVNRDDDPMDDRGHGTHVAATAAGNGVLKGVAPDARIYAYKVLDAGGRGSTSDIISAIEASVDPNKDGNIDDHLDVISLSLGMYCGGKYNLNCGPDDPMSGAIDNAVSAGVVAVVAAGNNGPNGLVGSPGIAKKAITVGAANTTGPTPTIAKFSSIGSYGSYLKPDIVAPGVRICAARYDSYAPGNECVDSAHVAISGTSMATPHVAGIVALMKQKSKSVDVEGWFPEGVKSALRATAVPIGNIPVKQGWGLVDAAAAVKLSHLPCSVAMDNLPPTASGTITLSAKISCNRPIRKWEFSYAKNDQIITSDTIEVSRDPSEPAAIEWDTSSVDDGQYWIKVRVEDDAGLIAEDAVSLKLDNLYLSSPMSNDVLRAGDILEIKGTAIGGPSSSYSLEYARGVDKSVWAWKTSGITLAGEGKNNIKDGVLGVWDTSGITAPDFYTIRLNVNTNNGLRTDYSFFMYLDPRLRKGWPVRVPFVQSVFTDDKMDVKPVDIDGDGIKELIILGKATHGSGEYPKLLVYSLDGTLRWKKEFPKPSWIFLPFFGQKNSLGEPAIYIVSSQGYPMLDLLHKLDAQGNEAPGWPAKLRGLFWEGIVADLDDDGASEIILKSLGGISNISMPFNFLNVLDEHGRQISEVKIPMCQAGWAERSKHAAIGNFDDDPELEIATHHGCTSIAAYNRDGSLVPGSVRDTGAMLWASLASGDVNNDGFDEIVAAGSNLFTGYNGGVYVFGKDGLLEGWPQFTDRIFTASPALGDINGDGFLDIAISDWSGFTHVLDYRGKELPGWPRKNEIWPWSYHDTSLTIADINGDNKADIISRGGGIQPALLQGAKMDSLGGIFAWNADGTPIDLNPAYPSNSLVMELWNGAPPVVTDLDNNGRVDLIGSSVAESAMCPLQNEYPECSYKTKWRHSVYIWEFPSAFSKRQSLWPMFQHDLQQTGSSPQPLPPACIDSDGSNIFTSGTAIFSDATFTDECTSSKKQVMEKLCIIDENGNLALSNTLFNCPEPDCTNGACISRMYDRKFEQKLVSLIPSGWVNAKPPLGKWGITKGASVSKPKGETDNVMVTDVNAKNKKTIPADGAAAVQIIPAEPGKTYRISVSAKAVSKSKTMPAIVYITPLDGKFDWVSQSFFGLISGFKNGKWETKSVEITARERTAYLKISLVNVRNIGGIVYWDDISVDELK